MCVVTHKQTTAYGHSTPTTSVAATHFFSPTYPVTDAHIGSRQSHLHGQLPYTIAHGDTHGCSPTHHRETGPHSRPAGGSVTACTVTAPFSEMVLYT